MKYRIKVVVDKNGFYTYYPQYRGLLWWKDYHEYIYMTTIGIIRSFSREIHAEDFLRKQLRQDNSGVVDTVYYKPYP